MYKYQDESGAVSITNSLESVPKKYRKGMTVIKEDSPYQNKLLPTPPPKSPEQLRQSEEPAKPIVQPAIEVTSSNRPKHIRVALIVTGLVLAGFVITRLSGSLGFPRLGMLVFLVIMIAGGVYLYGMYISELKSVFNGLRGNALSIKKNVETREQKTDNMLKQMPENSKEQQ